MMRNKCLLFKPPVSAISCRSLSRLRQSRWENRGTELTQPMESKLRLELGLLDLQTADSTHQARQPFAQQCLWKAILFYHWIVWEKTVFTYSPFLLPQCGKFKPFRQTACLYALRRHKDPGKLRTPKSPFSNYTPPGSSVSRPQQLFSTKPVLGLEPNVSQVGPGSKLIPDGLIV